jgi:hypothetical protein
MERRYLVAALAIIATFAVFSRGFRSLEQMSLLHAEHLSAVARAESAVARAESDARTAAQTLAKIRTHLRPAYPEEAQLLAEMNVPLPPMPPMPEIVTAPAPPVAPCARALALHEAERARREAKRMSAEMEREASRVSVDPISLRINMPEDFEQKMQQRTEAMAARLAAANVRLQKLTVNRMQMASVRIAESELPVIQVDTTDQTDGDVVTHVHCNVNSRWQQQTRQAVRDAVRQFQYGYASK